MVLCTVANRMCLKYMNKIDGNIMLNIIMVFIILPQSHNSCYVANKDAHSFLV